MKKYVCLLSGIVVSLVALLAAATVTAHAEGEIMQGGNAFASNVVMGAADNYGLTLVTASVPRVTISNTGTASFNGSVVLGNSANRRVTFNSQITGGTPFIFQGATDNAFGTSLVVSDPTANNTVTLPNASGTICLSSGNCGSTGDINQGGNAFGANVSIGAQDNFSVSLRANNVDRLTVTPNGEVAYKAHLVSGNPGPASTLTMPLNFAGVGATVTVTGTDTAGTITITTGKSPMASYLAIVGFSKSYASTPHVVLSPSNQAAAKLNGYTDFANKAGFALGVSNTPEPGATYSFSYQVIQ